MLEATQPASCMQRYSPRDLTTLRNPEVCPYAQAGGDCNTLEGRVRSHIQCRSALFCSQFVRKHWTSLHPEQTSAELHLADTHWTSLDFILTLWEDSRALHLSCYRFPWDAWLWARLSSTVGQDRHNPHWSQQIKLQLPLVSCLQNLLF